MSAWWQKYVVTALTHPVGALQAVFMLVIYLGLTRAMIGLLAERKSGVLSDLRLLSSDMALLSFLVGFLAGALAIVYRLHGRMPSRAAADEKFQQRLRRLLNDPFFLLDFGLYATAFLGLLTAVLLMAEVRGLGALFVWSLWLTQIFYTLTGVLILIALRAFALHVGRRAPSGAAENATETPPAAAPAAPAEAKSEAATPKATPGFADRMFARVGTWDLRYGTIAIAYLGMTGFVLQMWLVKDSLPVIIWTTFFYQLAVVAAAVGFVLLLTRVAEIMMRSRPAGEAAAATSPVQRFAAAIHSPYGATVLVMATITALAAAWGIITFWSARNTPPAAFWGTVTSTLFTVIAVVAVPLVFWSVWAAVSRPKAGAQAVPALLNDPYRLLTVIIYLLAYLGLINFVFSMWSLRGIAETRIWDAAMDDLFNTVVVAGVFVAMRAVIAAAVMARRGR